MPKYLTDNDAFLNENSDLQRQLLHDQQHTNTITQKQFILQTRKNCFFRNYSVTSRCIIFDLSQHCTSVYQLLASLRRELSD